MFQPKTSVMGQNNLFAVSARFPVLFRMDLNLGLFRAGPFGGLYYTMPLINAVPGEGGALGWIAGLRGSMNGRANSSVIFAEARVSADLGQTLLDGQPYNRFALTFAVGAELGMIKRRSWRKDGEDSGAPSPLSSLFFP